MPRAKKTVRNRVKVYFQKVDPAARGHRQSASSRITQGKRVEIFTLEDRTVESLWYDLKPEGFTFLDWHRAWNDGYPSEEHVALYNELHPDENEQIVLLDEDEVEDEDAH